MLLSVQPGEAAEIACKLCELVARDGLRRHAVHHKPLQLRNNSPTLHPPTRIRMVHSFLIRTDPMPVEAPSIGGRVR